MEVQHGYVMTDKELTRKNLGLASHQQLVLREREIESNRKIIVAVRSNSASDFLRAEKNET
jgi:hypothetical protein